jgi:hypothetical protein
MQLGYFTQTIYEIRAILDLLDLWILEEIHEKSVKTEPRISR